MNTFIKKTMPHAVATISLLLSSNMASAAVLEEIVVTAQKRTQSVQDIPFAISALSSKDLAMAGIDNLEEYAYLVPGLSISAQDNGRTQITIRGISSGEVRRGDNVSSETVGLYFDEIPLSLALYNPNLEPYDLARVEVLRGPQGTLYGSGSLAGTIRQISNAPELGEFSGKIDLSAAVTDGGDDSNAVKGMINIPMGDTAAARLVAYRVNDGGWIDNAAPSSYGGDDVNSGEKEGFRLSVLWQPSENLSIRPTYIRQDIDTDGSAEDAFYTGVEAYANSGLVEESFDPRGDNEQWSYTKQGFTDDIEIANLLIEYDFGWASLTSSSSWTDRDIEVFGDVSLVAGLSFGYVPYNMAAGTSVFGQPTIGMNFADQKTSESTSQELRLSSNSDGKLEWIAGVYYNENDSDWRQPLYTIDPALLTAEFDDYYASNGAEQGMLNEGHQTVENEQIAVFGEATYALNERWSGTIGARWYDVEQTFVAGFRGGLSGGFSENPPVDSQEDDVNPKLLVAYTPTDDLLFSVQASEGFRLGGPQNDLPSGEDGGLACEELAKEQGIEFDPDGFASETLWNYELAMKSTLADGSVQFNASIFHIDYEDLQISTKIQDDLDTGRICGSNVTTNAGEAKSDGVELEFVFQATENLTLSLNGAYIKAELESDLSNGSAVSGDDLLYSPDKTFAAVAYYEHSFSNDMLGYVNVMYQYTGEMESFYGNDPAVAGGFTSSTLDAYNTVNLRMGVQRNSWEIALTASNLLDESAATYRQSIGLPDEPDNSSGYFASTVLRPRTVGVNFRYGF